MFITHVVNRKLKGLIQFAHETDTPSLAGDKRTTRMYIIMCTPRGLRISGKYVFLLLLLLLLSNVSKRERGTRYEFGNCV